MIALFCLAGFVSIFTCCEAVESRLTAGPHFKLCILRIAEDVCVINATGHVDMQFTGFQTSNFSNAWDAFKPNLEPKDYIRKGNHRNWWAISRQNQWLRERVRADSHDCRNNDVVSRCRAYIGDCKPDFWFRGIADLHIPRRLVSADPKVGSQLFFGRALTKVDLPPSKAGRQASGSNGSAGQKRTDDCRDPTVARIERGLFGGLCRTPLLARVILFVVGLALAAILALRAGWVLLEDVWGGVAIALCGAVYLISFVAVVKYTVACIELRDQYCQHEDER